MKDIRQINKAKNEADGNFDFFHFPLNPNLSTALKTPWRGTSVTCTVYFSVSYGI